MKTLYIDFETYYSKDYSLSKMQNQTYITDPWFEVLMASVAVDDAPVVVLEADEIPAFLSTLDASAVCVVSHNSIFDQLILSHHYGFVPALSADTMAMARYLGWHVAAGGASLDALGRALATYAPHLNLPTKGKAVQDAKNKRKADFTPEEWQDYKSYCATDTVIMRTLWLEMLRYARETGADFEQQTSQPTGSMLLTELAFQDIVLKCATRPLLTIDQPVVEQELQDVEHKQEQALKQAQDIVSAADKDELLTTLRSNDRFAALLQQLGAVALAEHGTKTTIPTAPDRQTDISDGNDPDGNDTDQPAPPVIIPQKISKTTGKVTWAFGKTDQGMLDLLDCEDPIIEAVVSARLGTKSSIAQTRARSFLRLAEDGFLSVPYIVCGAHTGRLSGTGGINLQNLSSGRVKGQSNALRRSIKPKEIRKALIALDSSQVEVRLSAYISNNYAVTEAFRQGQDVYCTAAAALYGETYDHIRHMVKVEEHPEYKAKRQVAKAAVLSCQFGTGAKAFQAYAKVVGGVTLTEEQARDTVNGWRQANAPTVDMWRQINDVMHHMVAGGEGWFGGEDGMLCYYNGARHVLGVHVPGIRMPSGLWLNYRGLTTEQGQWDDGSPKTNFYFFQNRGRQNVKTYTYSSKIFENITQSIAYRVMAWQSTLIAQRYPVVMNAHDEWVIVVDEHEADEALRYSLECMCTAPPWAPNLLLNAEGSIANNYGDAK